MSAICSGRRPPHFDGRCTGPEFAIKRLPNPAVRIGAITCAAPQFDKCREERLTHAFLRPTICGSSLMPNALTHMGIQSTRRPDGGNRRATSTITSRPTRNSVGWSADDPVDSDADIRRRPADLNAWVIPPAGDVRRWTGSGEYLRAPTRRGPFCAARQD